MLRSAGAVPGGRLPSGVSDEQSFGLQFGVASDFIRTGANT